MLNTKQTDWLESMKAGKIDVEAWNRKSDAKEAILQALQGRKTDSQEAISEGYDYTLLGKDGQEERHGKDANHDAMREVDWGDREDMTQTGDFKEGDDVKLAWAQNQLADMCNSMRDATDEDGNPLFTDEEIMNELYSPMVRDGTMSENMVPAEYSQVMTTFHESEKLYNSRLEEFSATRAGNADTLEALDTSTAAVGIMENIVGGMAGAVGDKGGAELIKAMAGVATAGIATAKSVVEANCQATANNLGKAVSGVIGLFDKDLGKAVAAGWKVGMDTAGMAKDCADGKPEEAWAKLGEAIGGVMGMADPKGKNGDLAKMGAIVADAFVYSAAGASFTKAAVMNDKAAMVAIAESTANKLLTDAIKDKQKELHTEANKKLKAEGKPEEKLKPYKGNTIEPGGLSTMAQLMGWTATEIAATSETVAAAGAAAEQEELDRSKREFRQMLEMSIGGEDPDMDEETRQAMADLYDIDALIAQMQKDRAIIETAEKLVDTLGGALTTLVPALEAVIEGKNMIKNIVAALERGAELNAFLDRLNEAKCAGSVYAESISKRIQAADIAASQSMVDAVLAAAKMIGAATSSSGVGAPIGAAISGVAKAAQGISDLTFQFHKREELATAWRVFKEAVDNPESHKAARRAMSLNPTLAKYALAYGAVEQKDAIAIATMKTCGLNERTLANAKTNVEKVVAYMSERFNYESEKMYVVDIDIDWIPKDCKSLDLKSWTQVKVLALNHEVLKLAPGGGKVDRGFARLESSLYTKTKRSDGTLELEMIDDHIEVLDYLSKSLKAYKPVVIDHEELAGKPHPQVKAYCMELHSLVGLSKGEAGRERLTIEAAAASASA